MSKKKLFKYIVLFFFLFFIFACNENEKKYSSMPKTSIFFRDSIKSIDVKVYAINEEFLFGFPRKILFVDSLIYVYDSILKKKVNIFSNNGKYLFSFCEEGDSLGQIKQVTNMGFYSHDGAKLYLYDNLTHKILFCDFINNKVNIRDSIVSKLDTISNSNEIHILDDHQLFYLGNKNNSRYMILNTETNQFISSYSEFPQIIGVGNSPDIINSDIFFNTYSMRSFTPKMDRFVSATSIGEILEIFRISEKYEIIREKQIIISSPLIKTKNEKSYIDKKKQSGFYTIDVTDSYIFTVLGYIEKEGEVIKPNRKNFYIFDWNGNLLKNFKTDINVITFKVDEINNVIYVLGNKDQEKIKLYIINIKELYKQAKTPL